MLSPDFHFHRAADITAGFLLEHGVSGLALDLDNTLSKHGHAMAEPGVEEWLNKMRTAKIRMIIVSNNTGRRVAPLAKTLRLPFICFSCKPVPFMLRTAAKRVKLPVSKVLLVGDQLFTDILCGKLAGVRTALVDPFELENKASLRFKRRIEHAFFGRKADYGK